MILSEKLSMQSKDEKGETRSRVDVTNQCPDTR